MLLAYLQGPLEQPTTLLHLHEHSPSQLPLALQFLLQAFQLIQFLLEHWLMLQRPTQQTVLAHWPLLSVEPSEEVCLTYLTVLKYLGKYY